VRSQVVDSERGLGAPRALGGFDRELGLAAARARLASPPSEVRPNARP